MSKNEPTDPALPHAPHPGAEGPHMVPGIVSGPPLQADATTADGAGAGVAPAENGATTGVAPGEIAADESEHAEPSVRHIFRWDLDKTYLHTDFDTLRDLIRTAMQKPEEKVNVPGAVALLRELTRADEHSRALVTFISGSPTQMRATLERKFEIDGIHPDAFILKPTLHNILRGRFRAVRGQVGYKLEALLRLRQQSPPAPETFFGDDAEQDAFIYSLYADLVAGHIERAQLLEILQEAEVYEHNVAAIMSHVEHLTPLDNVGRIFIHLEGRSAPGRFWVFGPRLVPVINYFQAALVLYADGVLQVGSLVRVAAEMLQTSEYGLVELANSLQDLARRRHLDQEVLGQLARDWAAATSGEPGTPRAVEKAARLRNALPEEFVDRLIARVRALAPRAQLPQREWQGPVNYLEVLRTDRKMRKSVQPSRGLFS